MILNGHSPEWHRVRTFAEYILRALALTPDADEAVRCAETALAVRPILEETRFESADVEAAFAILDRAVAKIDAELSRSCSSALARRFPSASFAVGTKAGRWITIGGRRGDDGKRHGGSPVFVEGGRITRGAPSLAGKRIDALADDDDPGTTHRQQLRQSRDYSRAKVRKQAREEGIDPKHLDSLAAEMLAHDREFAGDREKALKRARQLSERLGYGSLQGIQARAARGNLDVASLRGFDDVSERLAEEMPHVFAGHESDKEQRLLDLLLEGNPERMSEQDVYEQALDVLREHKAELPAEDEVPFALR
jgi:hypothetical protein